MEKWELDPETFPIQGSSYAFERKRLVALVNVKPPIYDGFSIQVEG
jgi:hypothetical protein